MVYVNAAVVRKPVRTAYIYFICFQCSYSAVSEAKLRISALRLKLVRPIFARIFYPDL